MDEKKELQNRLLRYFGFGNSEEQAKLKVMCLSEDFKFFGFPLSLNVREINEHISEFNVLITFSDMHILKTIRECITKIKELQKDNEKISSVTKQEFQTQYLQHLQGSCGSQIEAIRQFKCLAGDMNDLGCPIGDNLVGVVMGSKQLQQLYSLSMLGVIRKVIDNFGALKS